MDGRIGRDYTDGEITLEQQQHVIDLFNKFSASLVESDQLVRHNVVVALASWYLGTEYTRETEDLPSIDSFVAQMVNSLRLNLSR